MESLKSGDAKTKEVTAAGTASAGPAAMSEATKKNIDFITKNLLAGGTFDGTYFCFIHIHFH